MTINESLFEVTQLQDGNSAAIAPSNDDRFIILDIPHNETNGTCWARNKIQTKYNGEDYTLQLDSHHRFVKGWDSKCIRMIKQLEKKGHKVIFNSKETKIKKTKIENNSKEKRINFDICNFYR